MRDEESTRVRSLSWHERTWDQKNGSPGIGARVLSEASESKRDFAQQPPWCRAKTNEP